MITKLTYENVKPFVEALKEGGRVVLIAIVPLLIEGLNKGAVDWRVIGVVAAIAGLRTLDKYLHLAGKENGNETLTRGITQF